MRFTPALCHTRQTGLLPMKLIDCDVHNAIRSWGEDIAPRLPAALRSRGNLYPGQAGFGSPIGVNRADTTPPGGGPPASDPAYLARHHLDKYGINIAVLTGSGILGYGVSADYRYAAGVVRAYNDWMVEVWLDSGVDERFRGSVLVTPQWPEAAVKEIKRLGGHKKIVQVIMCSASRMPLGHVQFWPIYEAACEMGLPVAVHPGQEGNGISVQPTPAGYPSSYFEWHNGLSQHYMAQVNSLVCEGVFVQFPQLKFVAIEGGIGWLPHLMWRMDKNWKALRATVPWLTEPPSHYILNHVRLTSQPIEEPDDPRHLLAMFEMMQARRTLLFSSDYPHWDFDDPKHAFPKMDEETRDRVYWRNAADLYQPEGVA